MKIHNLKTFAFVGAIAVGTLFSIGARANCGLPEPEPQLQQQSWHGQAHLMPVNFDADRDDAIAGFWNTVLVAKGNVGGPADGTILDKGLQQWHPDGTEFLNSSFQKPMTQNYCLGVWEKTGWRHYTLNHFAYAFDPTGQVVGIINIREELTLDRDGDSFSGTFTIDPYDALRNKLPGGVKGLVSAKRVDVRTKASDVL